MREKFVNHAKDTGGSTLVNNHLRLVYLLEK